MSIKVSRAAPLSFLVIMSALLMVAATPDPAAAQKISVAPRAIAIPYDPPNLYRVEDGVFEIREKQAVDLTDKSVLFNFIVDQRDGGVTCSVNGDRSRCRVGDRIDFLNHRALRTRKSEDHIFAGRSRCFLDVVRVTTLKGAPTTGVFRLFCE